MTTHSTVRNFPGVGFGAYMLWSGNACLPLLPMPTVG